MAGLILLGVGLWGKASWIPAPVDAGTLPTGRPAAQRPAIRQLAAPTQVVVARLGVDAPVVSVSVGPGGAVGVPTDPHVLGWWSGGAWPGSQAGTVVVVGHVDALPWGPGALFRLAGLPLGSTVVVRTVDGPDTYRVVARRVYDKANLPSSLFATSGPARLALVTCGGPYDSTTHHYADNVVVFATPTTT